MLSLPTPQQGPNFDLKLALRHCMALVRSLPLWAQQPVIVPDSLRKTWEGVKGKQEEDWLARLGFAW